MLGRIAAFWVEFGQKVSDFCFPNGVPKKLRIPKFSRIFHSLNFILLHCMCQSETVPRVIANQATDMYMIFMAMLGSVMLYGIGGMAYIDALFFAMGSTTQSGLNT